MNDRKKEGNFKWISGEPVNFTNFHKNEPNSLGDEDCVHTFPISKQWNDVSCDLKKQSICEMNYNVEIKVTSTILELRGSVLCSPTCSAAREVDIW